MKLQLFAAAALSLLIAGCVCQNGDKTVVRYEDFGARGDGKTCDFDALIAAHDYANKHNLPVRANDNATYYLSGADKYVSIQTDTDWGKAKFLVDDRNVKNWKTPIFLIKPSREAVELKNFPTLKKNQAKIDYPFEYPCQIKVVNENIRRYIRKGFNSNGQAQNDVFCVDKDGNVDMNAPILWDYDHISSATAFPIDQEVLTVRGGVFTTLVNHAVGKFVYVSRNIQVKRSNTVVENVMHYLAEEAGPAGHPYNGFIHVGDCAYVTIKNCGFSGHRITTAGTYDIITWCTVSTSFVDCFQVNDINDTTRWGVMGSNYCKNLLYDGCKLSRFDAHCGVVNATVRNSVIGWMGINAIGSGTFLIENTISHAGSFANFREDFGCIWDGNMIIRNCIWYPRWFGKSVIFSGRNTGDHDFGYDCKLPTVIEIENFRVMDGKNGNNYLGIWVFDNVNPNYKTADYQAKSPLAVPEKLILRNVTSEKGAKVVPFDNGHMFGKMQVVCE